jgi:hypothetical protein
MCTRLDTVSRCWCRCSRQQKCYNVDDRQNHAFSDGLGDCARDQHSDYIQSQAGSSMLYMPWHAIAPQSPVQRVWGVALWS